MGNIDWSKPIEWVRWDGVVFPARYLGSLRGKEYPQVVAVDYGGIDGIQETKLDGTSETPSHVRNIPEPKRGPLTLWYRVDDHGNNGLHIGERRPGGKGWTKFVEEVE